MAEWRGERQPADIGGVTASLGQTETRTTILTNFRETTVRGWNTWSLNISSIRLKTIEDVMEDF